MSYGTSQPLFYKYSGARLENCYKASKFVKDKHLNVYFYQCSRFKNPRKYNENCNNESLWLKYDSNLSSDFSYTELNMITGESFTISLIESDQPLFGTTKLVFLLSYVDKDQNLHETMDYRYCSTVPGTISKRLKHYHEAFKEGVTHHLAKYRDSGTIYNLQDKLRALASYIYIQDKKAERQIIYSFSARSSINYILVLYSIFKNDCFIGWSNYKDFEIFSWPHSCRNEEINEFSINSLDKDDSELLDAILIFYRNNERTVSDIFQECRSDSKLYGNTNYNYEILAKAIRSKFSIESSTEVSL